MGGASAHRCLSSPARNSIPTWLELNHSANCQMVAGVVDAIGQQLTRALCPDTARLVLEIASATSIQQAWRNYRIFMSAWQGGMQCIQYLQSYSSLCSSTVLGAALRLLSRCRVWDGVLALRWQKGSMSWWSGLRLFNLHGMLQQQLLQRLQVKFVCSSVHTAAIRVREK